MQEFFTAFSKVIKPDDTIVLAVSGGVDSMVLLDLVVKNHPKEHIVIAHFDHSLRGEESDSDREFVANFCDNNNLRFETEKIDIAKLAKNEKMSIENAARKYRYDFLFRMAEKYKATYIFTAHHTDDRIETAMFNLIRGTKLGGIHALSLLSSRRDLFQNQWKKDRPDTLNEIKRDSSTALRNDKNIGNIFRPLLGITKGEILSYAQEKSIEYREDSTNTDTDYQRNHLRKNILPEFEKINPEYRKAISNFIDYTEELKTWIDEEIVLFLRGKTEFWVSEFEKKSPFSQREMIRYLYEQANNGTVGLSEGNIEEVRRFILTAHGGREKKLSRLHLSKKDQKIKFAHYKL